jgi:hypothetical protein
VVFVGVALALGAVDELDADELLPVGLEEALGDGAGVQAATTTNAGAVNSTIRRNTPARYPASLAAQVTRRTPAPARRQNHEVAD